METVKESVAKTKRIAVIDGGWSFCGLSGEIIAEIATTLDTNSFLSKPMRFTIKRFSCTNFNILEKIYYPNAEDIIEEIKKTILV